MCLNSVASNHYHSADQCTEVTHKSPMLVTGAHSCSSWRHTSAMPQVKVPILYLVKLLLSYESLHQKWKFFCFFLRFFFQNTQTSCHFGTPHTEVSSQLQRTGDIVFNMQLTHAIKWALIFLINWTCVQQMNVLSKESFKIHVWFKIEKCFGRTSLFDADFQLMRN